MRHRKEAIIRIQSSAIYIIRVNVKDSTCSGYRTTTITYNIPRYTFWSFPKFLRRTRGKSLISFSIIFQWIDIINLYEPRRDYHQGTRERRDLLKYFYIIIPFTRIVRYVVVYYLYSNHFFVVHIPKKEWKVLPQETWTRQQWSRGDIGLPNK